MNDNYYDIVNKTEEMNWWYRVRRKIVRSVILKNCKKRNNLKILDAGCGVGATLKSISDLGNCFGIDSHDKAVNYCREKGIKNVRLGDITDLSFDDNSFDVILVLDVLEHIKDDEAAIKEMGRVLREDGLLIIFVPALKILWSKTDELSHHFRRYTLKELKNKINKYGFKNVRATYFNSILFLPILIIRFFIKIFKINISSENEMTPGLINKILYIQTQDGIL